MQTYNMNSVKETNINIKEHKTKMKFLSKQDLTGS